MENETIYVVPAQQDADLKSAIAAAQTVLAETEPAQGQERKLTPQAAWALSMLAMAAAYALIGPAGLLWQNAVPDPRL